MTARDDLAELARLLADDADVGATLKILAVQVLHRLQYGGRVASHDEWLLRVAAGRQRQAARRWVRRSVPAS